MGRQWGQVRQQGMATWVGEVVENGDEGRGGSRLWWQGKKQGVMRSGLKIWDGDKLTRGCRLLTTIIISGELRWRENRELSLWYHASKPETLKLIDIIDIKNTIYSTYNWVWLWVKPNYLIPHYLTLTNISFNKIVFLYKFIIQKKEESQVLYLDYLFKH